MSGTMKNTLSTGTMNLKFMQRSSNGAGIPALQQKEVIDEGAWDIGPEVRRAWGLENTSSDQSEEESPSLSYESSYLPFFVSSASSGRSRYSKHGVKSGVEDKDESGISGNAVDVSTSRGTATLPGKLSGISMKRSKLTPSMTPESGSVPVAQAPSANHFLRPRGIDSPALHLNSSEKKRKASVDGSDVREDARSPHKFSSDSGTTSTSPQSKAKANDQAPKKKKMWPPNDSQRF